MATFTGNIGVPSGGFTLRVDYSVSQNINNNTSTVSATGYVCKNNSSYYPYNTSSDVSLSINGSTATAHPSYNLGNYGSGSYMHIISHSTTFTHNSDGTKSISISLSMNGKLSNYYPNGSVSRSITLPTIPRASGISLSPSSVEFGKPITISISRASSSFTHTLHYTFANSDWVQIATGVATSSTFTPNASLMERIPNSTSGSGQIRCRTYNGSSLVGEKSASFTLTVPGSVVPTISSITATETVSGLAAKFGGFIQGKSMPQFTVSAKGISGSSISKYTTQVDDVVYSSNIFTTGIINRAGVLPISVAVTDSRGRGASSSSSITIIPYYSPSITSFSVNRCQQNGTPDISGTYVKVICKGEIASCNSKNSNSYKVEYKLSTASTWTSLMTGPGYALNISQIKSITGGFLSTNTYDFRITITDYFTSTSASTAVPTAFVLMNFNKSGKGYAVGKVSEKDALEVALPAEFSSSVKVKDSSGAVKDILSMIVFSKDEPTNQLVGGIWFKTDTNI